MVPLWCDEGLSAGARRGRFARADGGAPVTGRHRRPELPRRVPSASLPPEAYRAVGRASVPSPQARARWSADMITLARLLGAMRSRDDAARRSEAA